MAQNKLPLINSAHGSETRNIINELIKIFNGMGYTYDEALQKAHDTLNEAQQTNDMNEDVQNQLDNLIIESGNANAEVSQARGGLPLLKDRLDETDSQLAQTVEEVSIIRNKEKNIFDYKHLATNTASSDPNDWDWTVAIQTAIDEITSDYEYNVLRFPAGVFKISDDVGYWSENDVDIGLHIVGSGRTASTGRATTIQQTNPEKNNLTFRSSRSNLRGLVIRDIQLFGGEYGLYLENNVYNLFENVTFSRITKQCIRSSVGSGNFFMNCWGVHALANFAELDGTGTEFFVDCKIGEDVGGVSIRVGGAKFINCDFHDVRNRQEESGVFGLGNNAFYVDAGGRLTLDSCRVIPNRQHCEVIIITNNQRDCVVINSFFDLQNQKYLVSRSQLGTYQGSFNTLNNIIQWDGDGELFVDGMGSSSSPLRNSLLDGNTFNIPKDFNVVTEDWFIRPSFNNQIGTNIVKEV